MGLQLFAVARCSDHGLHGQRTDCHTCGGTVEQVLLVTRAQARDRERELMRAVYRMARREVAEELLGAVGTLATQVDSVKLRDTLARVRDLHTPMSRAISTMAEDELSPWLQVREQDD